MSIQRWTYEHHPAGFDYLDGYAHALVGEEYVLYSDHAIAVEAAVREATNTGYLNGCALRISTLARHGFECRAEGREQAIRDCIAAVEALHIAPWQWDHTSKDSYGDIRLEAWHEAAAALRALLDGAE